MVKSPLPNVSDAASRYDVIPPECTGNSDLPFGVDLEVSAGKSLIVPNGTG